MLSKLFENLFSALFALLTLYSHVLGVILPNIYKKNKLRYFGFQR